MCVVIYEYVRAYNNITKLTIVRDPLSTRLVRCEGTDWFTYKLQNYVGLSGDGAKNDNRA